MAKGIIDWCRIVMNESTKNLIGSLNYSQMDAFEISGRAWKRFGFKTYNSLRYPEFDVCEPPTVKNQYDIIIAEQVFEHVRYPNRGLQTVRDMLRPAGYFLITTPFLIKVHGSPVDYWRWTKEGMCYFLEDNGFEIVHADSWGNKECVKTYLNFETMPEYNEANCSLKNELDSPIMVWALARKI